ncbi:hypothetical protein AUG19_02110 [archaeon 13_1_20CM_2_54_9]|nr:MAG: hypothetical protein AUG19_02110 [archaeon 13_1_20CM_2_54_9]
MADGPSKLQSEIEMAKQVLAAVAGVRPEEIIIKEAQAHPYRSFATPADRDEHQANVLMTFTKLLCSLCGDEELRKGRKVYEFLPLRTKAPPDRLPTPFTRGVLVTRPRNYRGVEFAHQFTGRYTPGDLGAGPEL